MWSETGTAALRRNAIRSRVCFIATAVVSYSEVDRRIVFRAAKRKLKRAARGGGGKVVGRGEPATRRWSGLCRLYGTVGSADSGVIVLIRDGCDPRDTVLAYTRLQDM